MSEEQLTGATAEVAPAESALPTGETASQEAQPAAQQSAATTEQPNWDDPSNPYRERFNGTQGALRQLQAQYQQAQAQLRQLQEYNARIEAERQADAQRQSNLNMRQRLARAEEDPDEARTLVGELRQQLTVAEQATITSQQLEARARVYAEQQANLRYGQFIQDTAQELDLTPQEVDEIAQQSGSDYTAFRKGLAKRVKEKIAAPLHQEYQRQLTEAHRAGETEALARQRASERSPDAGSGLPSNSDDDQTFLREFNAGRSNDMRRARQLLERL